MTENRDPRTCAECGTVNPWVNEDCRSCGSSLIAPPVTLEPQEGESQPHADQSKATVSAAMEEPGDATPHMPETQAPPASPKPRRAPIHIRWVLAGAAILGLLVGVSEKWAESRLRADPEAWAIIQDATVKAEKGEELSDEKKIQVRDAITGNGWAIPLLLAMLLVFPFCIGVLVGYATHSVRDGILAVTGGMSLYMLVFAHFLPGVIIAVVVYSGVGALAGWAGKRLKRFSSS